MGFSLSSIFGETAKGIVEGVSKIADTFITNPDEKKAFIIETEKLAQDKIKLVQDASQAELDSVLKDVQSAREVNARIQESEKASWLSKNMAYIMDILVSIVWAGFTLYLGLRAINLIDKTDIDLTAVLSLYSTVTAVFMISMNFHRGTSRGSEKSGDALRQIARDK